MHAASDSTLPTELLDEIIDQLGETSALLSCGLVSQRVLVKTRPRLFSTLKFTSDRDFDRFLDLVSAPWTSFTPVVEAICLHDLFSRNDDYRDGRDPKTIASNLCNVKALCIVFQSHWSFRWRRVRQSVLDIIFEWKIHDLHLERLYTSSVEDTAKLFNRLSPTLKTLAFSKLETRKMEKSDLLRRLPIFRRPLHFRMLDNASIAFLADVLDPLDNPDLDVTIHTFHIRDIPSWGYSLPWRFLKRFGCGIERLLITLNSSIYGEGYLEPTQVVGCINVRALFIKFSDSSIYYAGGGLVSAMWKILSALPSPNLLEELQLQFNLDKNISEAQECLYELGFFDPPNCLERMFPNLKRIEVALGTRKLEKTDMIFEALRQVKGLRELEEIGIVKLVIFNVTEHAAWHSNVIF